MAEMKEPPKTREEELRQELRDLGDLIHKLLAGRTEREGEQLAEVERKRRRLSRRIRVQKPLFPR
jgi:ElaB/YqjD/DUF883 family membrane-anchored ribosome-binding protein